MADTRLRVRNLGCCVCANHAGKWLQHWNRDDGFGICPRCAASEATRLSPETMASYYGAAGVNYGLPEPTA